MDEATPKVSITLWEADALVLYQWLMDVDLDAVPITHKAEKQALVDLLTRLGIDTTVEGATQPEIEEARELVARDMGW